MNAAEELMFLRNHRVQLVTVITKLTNRYIATEYDGTDVRKAAELDGNPKKIVLKFGFSNFNLNALFSLSFCTFIFVVVTNVYYVFIFVCS